MRPVIFIGSSNEGLEIANVLQVGLQNVSEPIVWSQGVFQLGQSNLENLVSQLDKYDFAILVFSPDDLIESRGAKSASPRDNILLELGLFLGALGRARTFVVFDQSAGLKIPTDLAGVSLAPYCPPEAGNLESALGPPCYQIRTEIRRMGLRARIAPPRLPATPPVEPAQLESQVTTLVDQNQQIIGSESGPPTLDTWYNTICPVLPQSTYYSTPAYYLDVNLNIIDWNVAFELIFQAIAPRLRYQHVNQLIARLINYDEVFQHGRQFSNRVHQGEMPFCDTEVLQYCSERFGDVEMLKVATQLHDSVGTLRAWAVHLYPRHLDWELFQKDIENRISEDKLWSIYASSYDRILSTFPPYAKLISDVCSVIPESASKVMDVGAGTGNVAAHLLSRGLYVVSLEHNAAMIEKMRAKKLNSSQHLIAKASAESLNHIPSIADETFDAVVMVNVLYSVDDPYACLTGAHRILKPGGVLGLSTTHSAVSLSNLLASIKTELSRQHLLGKLSAQYNTLYELNKKIERTIARRNTAEKYLEWVEDAGFEIIKSVEFTYEGAVMLIHARKR